jgi:hypothetical protein
MGWPADTDPDPLAHPSLFGSARSLSHFDP